METIIINRNKLKIMLTPPDMQTYDIAGEPLDCTDDATRRALRRIIEDARRGTDFDTNGQQLFIQLYASRDGGCEIFVTKLGAAADSAKEPPEQVLLRRVLGTGASDAQALPAPPAAGTRPAALLLHDLDSLTAVCARLCSVGYAEDSRAYILEDGRYCLLLWLPDTSFFRLPQPFAFLAEYGETADASVMNCWLCEHGQEICPSGAVGTLGKLV